MDVLDYLSDESEFYGNEKTVARFEKQVANFSTLKWWRKTLERPTPKMVRAQEGGVKRRKVEVEVAEKKQVEAWNPYEGKQLAWQLDDDVSEFLQKYRPSKIYEDDGAWIRLAYPYCSKDDWTHSKGEGPAANEEFIIEANAILHKLKEDLSRIDNHIDRPASKRNKSIGSLKTALKEEALKKLSLSAQKHHCVGGKWMLFPEIIDTDIVWAAVARATHAGELGTSASVTTNNYSGKGQVVCVNTKDFNDMVDVRRVAQKLKDLKILNRVREMYYKPDVFTDLELYKGNPYGLRSWIYSTEDMTLI